jgi:hypothetical protein
MAVVQAKAASLFCGRGGRAPRGGPAALPLPAVAPPGQSADPQRLRNSFIVVTCAWSLVKPSSPRCQASSMVRSIE